jgi:hypothetical protein
LAAVRIFALAPLAVPGETNISDVTNDDDELSFWEQGSQLVDVECQASNSHLEDVATSCELPVFFEQKPAGFYPGR